MTCVVLLQVAWTMADAVLERCSSLLSLRMLSNLVSPSSLTSTEDRLMLLCVCGPGRELIMLSMSEYLTVLCGPLVSAVACEMTVVCGAVIRTVPGARFAWNIVDVM